MTCAKPKPKRRLPFPACHWLLLSTPNLSTTPYRRRAFRTMATCVDRYCKRRERTLSPPCAAASVAKKPSIPAIRFSRGGGKVWRTGKARSRFCRCRRGEFPREGRMEIRCRRRVCRRPPRGRWRERGVIRTRRWMWAFRRCEGGGGWWGVERARG